LIGFISTKTAHTMKDRSLFAHVKRLSLFTKADETVTEMLFSDRYYVARGNYKVHLYQ